MRKIYNLLTLVIGMVLLGSCEDDKEPVFVASDAVSGTLNSINENYVLSAESSEFATFTFTETDLGLQVAKTYGLEASLQKEFSVFKQLGEIVTSGKGGSLAITAETMNSAMLEWDVEAGTATTVYFRIKTAATDASSQPTDICVYSNIITSVITPYSGERVYPEIYVIGDYSSWGWDAAQSLFCFSGDDASYEGVIDFADKAASGFKLTGAKDWATTTGNWGPQGDLIEPAEPNEIQLINDGGSGNIKCYSKRFYHFSFNKNTLKLTKNLAFDVLSICGDAGPQVSGWGEPGNKEVDMSFDPEKQRFYADVELEDGNIKFRADHIWDNAQWGLDDEGSFTQGGNNNIAVKAGTYRIYLNINNSAAPTYELNSKDYQK